MNVIRNVILPPDITMEHRLVVDRYIHSINMQTSDEWVVVVDVFNRLRFAVVIRLDGRAYTFAQIYEEFVDTRYATPFIKALYQLDILRSSSTRLWAHSAQQIVTHLKNAGLYDAGNHPASRFLLAYCLYWWQSFCKGYTFEIEIFQDLKNSGLRFEAHNLLDPAARLSPYDLLMSDFRGDIKTSTYFLQKVSRQRVSNDFFITKMWLPSQRSRILVVFLQELTWDEIDGETLFTQLTTLETVLPNPARIAYHSGELVVSEYIFWKQKMREYQISRGELP